MNQVLKDAENWLASVKGREDPQTKLIRSLVAALTSEVQSSVTSVDSDLDGSVEAWDLDIYGRGISLSVTAEAGNKFIYALIVDGKAVSQGEVG